MRSLDLALIGNGRIGLLVDHAGTIVWGCFPRFDGDPAFCALLDDAPDVAARGLFGIELVGGVRSEQEYVANTAVLVTRHFDNQGGTVDVFSYHNFSGRFFLWRDLFCPRERVFITADPLSDQLLQLGFGDYAFFD